MMLYGLYSGYGEENTIYVRWWSYRKLKKLTGNLKNKNG